MLSWLRSLFSQAKPVETDQEKLERFREELRKERERPVGDFGYRMTLKSYIRDLEIRTGERSLPK